MKIANYDFNTCLSPERFQDLGRDLLQIKYDKYAESFKKVKDDGIDIRLRDGDTPIYGQVKRFNNFANLKHELKNEELKKVKKINPERYILITSLDYTPKQKDEIMQIMEGYIKAEEDIIGRTDINNLLTMEKYKNLQRKYYELWMDSFEIMEELISYSVNKHIYNASKEKLKEILKNENTYIESKISEEAENILENNNCILITGEAGIGKTSLGYHLTCKMLQNSNAKFIYAYSPEEILRTYKEEENQIFFIDDFWGSILENSYEKREEKKFIDVIDMINNDERKKLILTTRDYILEEGLKKHPKVYDEFLTNKIILKLKEFSRLLKVKILFRHLGESKLDWNIVDEIASGYKLIIQHSMYNPRLIAEYIREIDKKPKKKNGYVQELLNYLDNPEEFIKDIFEEQTETVKVILILLVLMRRETQEEELKKLFYDYCDYSKNDAIKKSDFAMSIKKIDGSLIKIYRDDLFDEEIVINVTFQNPSVEEYVYHYLEQNIDDYANDIVNSTNSLNLLASLTGVFPLAVDYQKRMNKEETCNKLISKSITENIVNKLIQSYEQLEYVYQKDIMDRQFNEGYSELDKLRMMIEINKEIGSTQLREFIQGKIDTILDKLIKKERFFTYEDMYEAIPLIKEAKQEFYQIKYQPEELIQGYYENIKFAYQYKLMGEFLELYPNAYQKFIQEKQCEIKSGILNLVIEDVAFYEDEWMKEDLAYLIEIELPAILEMYNMTLPKWVKEEIEEITGYVWWKPKKKPKKVKTKKAKKKKPAPKPHYYQPKETKEDKLIQKELINLLGEDKNEITYNKKELVFDKIKDKQLATQFYEDLCNIQYVPTPIRIMSLRFFKRVLTFVNKKNKRYTNFHEFMDEFVDYLLGKTEEKEIIKKKLAQFSYEMCMSNKNIWREEEVRNHSAFIENQEIVDILIKCKILERNKQWIEFYNDLIFWYFCIIQSIEIDENALDFMHKLQESGALLEKESFYILIYESIAPEKMNKEFISEEIKRYVKEIEADNQEKIVQKIIKSCEYVLNLDSKLNDDGEGYYCLLTFNILEYLRYNFCEDIPSKIREMKKNPEDFKVLKEKFYKNSSYEIDFEKCIKDETVKKLFRKYGIWNEFYGVYQKCIAILKELEESNYKIKL